MFENQSEKSENLLVFVPWRRIWKVKTVSGLKFCRRICLDRVESENFLLPRRGNENFYWKKTKKNKFSPSWKNDEDFRFNRSGVDWAKFSKGKSSENRSKRKRKENLKFVKFLLEKLNPKIFPLILFFEKRDFLTIIRFDAVLKREKTKEISFFDKTKENSNRTN